ncbi:hypothetical protein [Fibrivirga algicola]|uniref:UPF0323 domain-containing protein n=1 Tax=Fibrivirga algicola TaxID=2950420 RepID=A0ABX0QKM0_9BACT|nr:hypothetical protein [Fibrivirga algicola]NID11398.1 hypothetical protein [Fibrivirga algicola]
MTILKQGTLLRRVKDITLSTTLTIALVNGTVMLQSCGNNRSEEAGGSYGDGPAQETVTFKKGVRSVITETAPGEFKITDEVEADPSQSGAIVKYKDGHADTLSVEAARKLVQNDPSTSRYFNDPGSYGQHHSNGLANALLWGGLGYMIGRSTAPRYNEQRYSSGFYTNPNTYNRSQQLGRTVTSSRVVTSRPSGGRSGFFSRGSSGRGFSG